jgi:ArsR family transcriptional regulator, lead/cadmium/zinc/bismuth-responsive transcriptional repressor
MADACDLLCLDLPKAEAVRGEQLAPYVAERAAGAARALADPTRLNVAVALSHADELCGCDLSWISGRSQKLVSHHLKVLRQAGLVESRREGRVVYFSLTMAGATLLEALGLDHEARV